MSNQRSPRVRLPLAGGGRRAPPSRPPDLVEGPPHALALADRVGGALSAVLARELLEACSALGLRAHARELDGRPSASDLTALAASFEVATGDLAASLAAAQALHPLLLLGERAIDAVRGPLRVLVGPPGPPRVSAMGVPVLWLSAPRPGVALELARFMCGTRRPAPTPSHLL